MEVEIKDTYIQLVQGDITKISADAIVNAANSSLMGGGGVDGAIHRAGGKAILEECMAIRNKKGGCGVGEAVITTAGNLDARYVIHTVGPVWNGGAKNEEEKLRYCYINSLDLAQKHEVTSIAIPNISTGIYRFPKELAAKIALDEIYKFIEKNQNSIKRVLLVSFDVINYNIYKNELKNSL